VSCDGPGPRREFHHITTAGDGVLMEPVRGAGDHGEEREETLAWSASLVME
jgi:hypothetical protein